MRPLHSKEGAEVAKHLFWIFAKINTTFDEAEIPKNAEGDFVIVSVRQAITAISIAGGQ